MLSPSAGVIGMRQVEEMELRLPERGDSVVSAGDADYAGYAVGVAEQQVHRGVVAGGLRADHVVRRVEAALLLAVSAGGSN
jgi:hypothetical protein